MQGSYTCVSRKGLLEPRVEEKQEDTKKTSAMPIAIVATDTYPGTTWRGAEGSKSRI